MGVPVPEVPESIQKIADSEDRHLAWQFFVFFSRFEYALKRTRGYVTQKAEPNWDRFASDHNDRWPSSARGFGEAVGYFEREPPRKQIVSGGALGWSEPQAYDGREPKLVWLLRVVRTVRNNLFHGGKFPLIPISDPSRDRELLLHAINILTASIGLSRDVEAHFSDDAE